MTRSSAPRAGTAWAAPWRWRVAAQTLQIELSGAFDVLSWAPLGGGIGRARAIFNHQIRAGDRSATQTPRAYLARLVRSLGYDSHGAAAMMTGASVARAAHAAVRRVPYLVEAWCSAGCSNALRAGDRASADEIVPGTINLVVLANLPMTRPALLEALQIATEARVVAMQGARVRSTRSGLPATGTGTDCILVGAPAAPGGSIAPLKYCGKHTRMGELIGRAVTRACAQALTRSRE